MNFLLLRNMWSQGCPSFRRHSNLGVWLLVYSSTTGMVEVDFVSFFPMPLPWLLKKTQSNLLTVKLSVIYKLSTTLPSPIEKPIYEVYLGQYIILCEASQKT